MEFYGENWVKPNLEEIKRLRRKYVEFKDEIYQIHWTVIYDNEMYFIFKIGLYDDCHEFEGVAQTTEIYEIIDEIKESYEIQDDVINEDIELEHMNKILDFLEKVWDLDGWNSFEKGIFQMKKQLEDKIKKKDIKDKQQ
ncbi:hypothetical protein RBU49_02910 [Clostridium sp. MB40-C1]|uniref:hypothetical protein n=1 Tax=Clostridium sp. MB40-C1 TaxID=3070996 RepID=UPI0027E20163|nr:hypothetical protein [Clostridium sp. MB40-C1]WMJ81220.1 hypothetical protein RBU49_02910 [Clostridium sp. MB40-C1]